MTYHSKKSAPVRIKLRIPAIIELEGEGFIGVAGGVFLAAFALAIIYFY